MFAILLIYMEFIIDSLREFFTDAGYFSKICHACAGNALQSAKMFE